jgi:hypothetical protein
MADYLPTAEVVVPRDLFAVILDRVSELRLAPG